MNCANHPDRERVAFCQDCGKPLCQECTRTIGSAVYCEESLAARLGGGGAPPPVNAPAGGPYNYTGPESGANYAAPGAIPPPLLPDAPNPGLAALLGFIPGVGAMYNGQYAKGVVHLIVFAILVSLAGENGIFGLFIAGWVFYQVIEAHHTARARRDGTPLPNPFGLNDIGERLGFGRSWPGSTPFSPTPHPGAAPTGTAYAPPGGTYGAPPAGYPNYTAQPSSAWGESFAPPTPPYAPSAYPADPNLSSTRNRFPAGAICLIGLGMLFLIGNAGIFEHFPIHRIVPFLLIGLGVWLFVHKLTEQGGSLANDGTPAYQQRLYCALRGSAWIVLVGVLFLLDSFDILSWSRSWPLFIIVAGLMAIFRRTSYTPASFPAYPYAPPYAAPQTASQPAPPAQPGTSIVPSMHNDQEGK